MPGPPTFHGTAKGSARLRRRAAVGGAVALGVASLLVIGGIASPIAGPGADRGHDLHAQRGRHIAGRADHRLPEQ